MSCRLDLVFNADIFARNRLPCIESSMSQVQHTNLGCLFPHCCVHNQQCVQRYAVLQACPVTCQLGGDGMSLLKVGQVSIGSLQEGDDCVPSPPPLASLLVQTFSHLHC